MIGSRVSATFWTVQYSYKHIKPRPEIIRPGQPKPPEKGDLVGGDLRVLTADPTGSDLHEVVAREVLGGELESGHEFTVHHVHRVCDVCGVALLNRKDD